MIPLFFSCSIGTLTGKVTVEGGISSGIAVIAYGPKSVATVTADDGRFSLPGLPDGKYVVRVTVRGAEVEEQSVTTDLVKGKANPEPDFLFKLSSAQVTGRVVMADGSDAASLTVTIAGEKTRSTLTDSSGAFSFLDLKAGAYVVSVEAPFTRESRVTQGVNAEPTTSDIELKMTPIGRLKGTVIYKSMPVEGANVVVPGTGNFAVTDAMGRFQFDALTTGPASLHAVVGEPFFRSGTMTVTVLRGENPEVMLTLSDEPQKTGTVQGTVSFHGPRSPQDITVSVLGANVSVHPQVNGVYSFALPVGDWDVVATAPLHPTQVLGRVYVHEGQTESVPGQELSWYRPAWKSASLITQSPQTMTGIPTDNLPWSLVQFGDPNLKLALVNATTTDFRIVATGTTAQHRISSTGKYAGWVVNGTVFVYEIDKGALTTFAAQENVNEFAFSTDETALFVNRAVSTTLSTLTRIRFSDPTLLKTFPAVGTSLEIQHQGNDRWFVKNALSEVQLVTPESDVPQIFTAVKKFSVTPTAWALTGCTGAGTACQLRVLAPMSELPAVQDTALSPAPVVGSFFGFSEKGFDSRSDFPCFISAGNAFCVQSTDGAHFPLKAVPIAFKLNESGKRFIYSYVDGANDVVQDQAMPPQLNAPTLGTSTVGWSIGWLSPTRSFALQGSPSNRKLYLSVNGVPVVDEDIGPQDGVLSPPLLVLPRAASAGWRVVLGDAPIRTLSVSGTESVVGTCVRPLGTGAVSQYAAVSFDQLSAFIIDEKTPSLQKTQTGYAPDGQCATRSGAFEFTTLNRLGSLPLFHVFNTQSGVEFNEGSALSEPQPFGSLATLSYTALSADKQTILVGRLAN